MSAERRIYLMFEMAALYVLLPLCAFAAMDLIRLPLLAILVAVLVIVVFVLSLEGPSFSWRRVFSVGITGRHLAYIILLFLILGGALTAAVYLLLPESFLSFPRYRRRLWLLIMVFYPLVSVTTQEILYRVFFVHRYGALFQDRPLLAIFVNTSLFAFGHIIFGSWVTVAVSFGGGLIFAWRYFTTRSFWAVTLEHSLYGMLVFTVGLGRYFFTGVPFA